MVPWHPAAREWDGSPSSSQPGAHPLPGLHRESPGHPQPPLPGPLVPQVHWGQQPLPLRGQGLPGADLEPLQVVCPPTCPGHRQKGRRRAMGLGAWVSRVPRATPGPAAPSVLQVDPSRIPAPRHVWSQHTLPITDLHCGFGGPLARVATASLDQTVKVAPPRLGAVHHTAGSLVAGTALLPSCQPPDSS